MLEKGEISAILIGKDAKSASDLRGIRRSDRAWGTAWRGSAWRGGKATAAGTARKSPDEATAATAGIATAAAAATAKAAAAAIAAAAAVAAATAVIAGIASAT